MAHYRSGRMGEEHEGSYGPRGEYEYEGRAGRLDYEGRAGRLDYERHAGRLDYERHAGRLGYEGPERRLVVEGRERRFGYEGPERRFDYESHAGRFQHEGPFGYEPRSSHEYRLGWGGTIRYGRGPKGYKRSDERIREEVCERISNHPEIDASDVEVKSQGGEITLTGTVHERRIKLLIEQIADAVHGVQEIYNQIRVKREETPRLPHAGLTDRNDPLPEGRYSEGRRAMSP